MLSIIPTRLVFDLIKNNNKGKQLRYSPIYIICNDNNITCIIF